MENIAVVGLLLWAVFAIGLAGSKGYFKLSPHSQEESPYLSLRLLLVIFFIYFATTLLLGPWGTKALLNFWHQKDSSVTSLPTSILAILQTLLMLLLLGFISLAIRFEKKGLFSKIWKWDFQTPALADFTLGSLSWLISFPSVTMLSDLSEQFIEKLFGPQAYEQAAVQYVKSMLESPVALVFAVVSVVFLAPLIEELLFRGIFQNFFKRFVGAKASILLSSFTFAIFHFSSSQGWGNISLFVALFFLGSFLGFLYERQASLLAPIGLHMTFNAISTFRIILFPGS